MTTPTVWAPLPNAPHIDRVLAHAHAHQQAWHAAYVAARGAALDAAWSAAWAAARDAAWAAVRAAARAAARAATWAAAWSAAWTAAWAVRDATLALVAWDDAGLLLDMPVDAVRLLAASGHPPAVLMLPACIALSSTT